MRARRVQYLAGAHRGRAAAEGAAELAASVGPDAPPALLIWVLAAVLYAGGPGSDGLPSPRVAAAAGRELFTLARGRDPELVLLALEAHSAALAAIGDSDGAYALIGAYARFAEHEGASWPHFQVLLHRGFCAAAEGRFGECEQLAAEVVRLGGRLAPATVVDAFRMACLYVPRWLTGRAGELLDPMQDLRRWLDAPEAAAAVAFLAAEGGFPEVARAAFADVMRNPGPGGIEPGLLRDVTLFNLVGACVRAGDVDAAGELREVLHSVADDTCVYGGRIFLGTYRFHLGRLAMTRGHWEWAVADFEIALDRHRRARAVPWVALSAQALSDALTCAGTGAEGRARAVALRAEARSIAAKIGMRDPAELVGPSVGTSG